MPGSGQASPTCAHNNPVNVNDGTLCRAQSPAPVSVGFHPLDSCSWAAHFLGGEFESAKSHLRGTVDSVERHLRSDYEGAKCIYDAYELALDLAPEAILKETGYEISSLLSALIPGLLQVVVVVGATTFLGAAIGGIVGFLFGGVGAIPGAAVGGELGLDLGVAILTWLGVAFLVVSIAKGFVEMLDALRNGIEWAWAARILPKAAEAKQVSAAAHELARTVGILFRLILQAIVVYLLKKAAVGATRGATTTAGAVQAEGAAAVSDATVAELVGKLRSSKFGGRFATWVEENWRDIVKNPRLKEAQAPRPSEGTGGGGTSVSDATRTPPKGSVAESLGAKPPRDMVEEATIPEEGAQPVPETPKVVAQRLRSQATAAEKTVTPQLQELAVDSGGKLEGLDYRLKTKESLARKIATDSNRRGVTPSDAGGGVNDALRYTMVFDDGSLSTGATGVMESLEKAGYTKVQVKNTFLPDSPYKGVNTVYETPTGQRFELQFHSPESYNMKQSVTHTLYETARLPGTPRSVQNQLLEQMRSNSSSVPQPDNIDLIKNFP